MIKKRDVTVSLIPLFSNSFEGKRNLPEENVGKRPVSVSSSRLVYDRSQSVATLRVFLRVETLTNQLLSDTLMMPISKIASSRNEASIPTCRPIFSFFILYRIFEERNIQMRGYFWKKNKSLCNEVRLIKLWICTLANWLFSIPKRNIIDAVSVLAQRREHELWYSESILTGLKIMVLILSYKFFCCLIYIFLPI